MRFAWAQINFSTRRGTEDYHGTLFEFFRNDVLNARSFLRALKENLRLKISGGISAAPPRPWNAGRKKLFFFGGQEYKRRIDGDTRRATIPTRE